MMRRTTRREVALFVVPSPRSASLGRQFLHSQLKEFGLDELAEDADLLVTEVVSNAVAHAHTPITLRAQLSADAVTVEVADGSTAVPRLLRTDSVHEHGRGLMLVDALADAWGVTRTDSGKIVWFTLTAPRPRTPATLRSAG